jgi:hypothetical protein
LIFQHLSWDKIAEILESALKYAMQNNVSTTSIPIDIKSSPILDKMAVYDKDTLLKGHHVILAIL